MSSAVAGLKLRVDENKTEKYNNVKKIDGEGIKSELPKRAALGDIKNRALPRAGQGKDNAKDLKDAKLPATRGVKPRVDTYWKKGVSVSSESNATATTSRGPTTTKTTRPATVTTALPVGGIQRQVVANGAPPKEIKTLTTKLVENKVQQVKIIKKDKILPGETKLRREDSNLSRKSLSKLKAALARDVKPVLKPQSNEVVPKLQQILKPNATNAAAQFKASAKAENVSTIGGIVHQTKETNLRIINVESHSTALIEGVRNIDDGDKCSIALVSDYVNDIYEYLFQLEKEQPIKRNHLAAQIDVSPKMRGILLDWINEVHWQFHLVTETFHMAVGIIDRYLQMITDTRRSRLQLVGITALFIAAKYEELYPPAMADFIYMTDHTYTEKQILEMEIQIFKTLDFNLSRPISIHFLRRFSKASDIVDEQHCMSKYFLELAAINYELSSYRPSEIAAASLFLSLHLSKENPKKPTGFNDSHWDATLEYYSHYTAEDLRPITRKIAAIARNAPTAELSAIYTKYRSPKLHKASLRTELYSPLMDSIINSED